MTTTHLPDRSAEPPAEACETREVAALIIVRAHVRKGTTADHLAEFVTARLTDRTPDLHEDIFDDLTGALKETTGRALPSRTRWASCAHCNDTRNILLPGGPEPCVACGE